MTNENRCWCVMCHEYKVQYTRKYRMCQKCYREYLGENSYYKYKEVKKPNLGSSAYKICEIAINENLKPREIVEKYGEELNVKNVAYVRSIMTMYLEKCDTMGRPKAKKGEIIEVKKIG